MLNKRAELQKKKKAEWERLPFKQKIIYPAIAIIAFVILSYYLS